MRGVFRDPVGFPLMYRLKSLFRRSIRRARYVGWSAMCWPSMIRFNVYGPGGLINVASPGHRSSTRGTGGLTRVVAQGRSRRCTVWCAGAPAT